MKPASEWKDELRHAPGNPRVIGEVGRGGAPTLKIDDVYLHSRYRPEEEAQKLVASAHLNKERPVLVIGIGLGYHVLELVAQGYEVAIVEADPAVARLAIEGPLAGAAVPLGIGDPDALAADAAFRAFAQRQPQVFPHPATARVLPAFVEAMIEKTARLALARQVLRIAVVGPMFGGSLPIARYVVDGFRALGHQAILIDNEPGWAIYHALNSDLKSRRPAQQLMHVMRELLNEWSLARTVEFGANLCLVIAQAPVTPQFPLRLREADIVTAYWFMENWRHMDYWRAIAPRYDSFFHIQPGDFEAQLEAAGCRHFAHIPTACDPAVHRPATLTPEEAERYGCALSFAGAGYRNRQSFLAGLTDYKPKIWGVDWNAPDVFPYVQDAQERFTPEKFAKIVAASKINLNLHASTTCLGIDPNADAINPRVFEIAACGGFQLCDPCKGIDAYFCPETEVPLYRDLKDLRAKIDYFLARPGERQAYAEQARARALRDHTYKHRAQEMLDAILSAHGRRILRKGVRVVRTCGEIAERAGKDSPLGSFLERFSADAPFLPETVESGLAVLGSPSSYPEHVFTYMGYVRAFAEEVFRKQG